MVHIDKIMQNAINRGKEKIKQELDEHTIRRYKKVYCVIQRKEAHYKEGLFACYLAAIKLIYEAKERGLTPIVDMQTYKNPYLAEHEVGKKNAWELFFQQPAGIGLDQVKGKKNVIYLYEPPFHGFPSDSMEFLTNESEILFWRRFARQNIRLSKAAKSYLERYGHIIQKIEGQPTLGVYLRGTDYAGIQPRGHAVVPTIEESIQKTKEVMSQSHCRQIFLSAEDETAQVEFQKEFGDGLLYIDQLRYSKADQGAIMLTDKFVQSDVAETGLKYLAAVSCIAKCRHLVAARCCGAVGALLLSEGYDSMYFWNKGRYKQNHLNQPEKDHLQ